MFSSIRNLLLLSVSLCAAHPLDKRASSSGYDYIVVGGGTTGLVVANRLTENANISVLVIEAGASAFNNAEVYATGGYGEALGTAIDWSFKTTAQAYDGQGKALTLHAGKAIGGTSTINGRHISGKDLHALTCTRNVIHPSSGCRNRFLAGSRESWLDMVEPIPILSEE